MIGMITQVADGVHFVRAKAVNWTVLTDGDAVTLIDAGYPGELPTVIESLSQIGHRPEQIVAVLITHAHVDHIGSLPRLLELAPDAQVLTSAVETHHAHREYLEQAGPGDVATNLWRHGVLPWTLHLLRAGAMKDIRVPQARPFSSEGGALDVPGRPVPVATPGHTSGHTCYHLPDRGVMVTGDTLVTGHPISKVEGPQLLHPMFNHDEAATASALDTLQGFDADVILPGHGPFHRGSLREAAATARTRWARSRG